jgi:hypothetical protein
MAIAVIGGTWLASDLAVRHLITSPAPIRVLVTLAMLTPVGLVLGAFFPTGIRLVRDAAGDHAPWYWGLNGVFGVLAASSSTLIAVYAGVSVTFALAALAYAGVALAVVGLRGGATAAR